MRRWITRTAVSVLAAATVIAGPIGEASAQPPELVLPDVPDRGVARAQIFETFVDDRSVYEGNTYFVRNGALDQPDGVMPGAYREMQYCTTTCLPDLTVYTDTGSVDNAASGAAKLQWLLDNHPDWVTYGQDRTSVSFYSNYAHPPIDFTNPEAREWWWDEAVQPVIDAGYHVLELDMLTPMNIDQRAGHYDESGEWIQKYDPEGTNSGCSICFDDMFYAEDVVDFTEWFVAEAHKQDLAVMGNVWIPPEPSDWEWEWTLKVAEQLDIVMEEGGIVNKRLWSQASKPTNGLEDELWANRFNYYRHLANMGKYLIISDDNTMKVPIEDLPAEHAAYSVANYFLYREHGTMLSFGRNYHHWGDREELHADIGFALGDPIEGSNGVWTRSYSEGMTFVNPSSTATVTVPLPAGAWVDQWGNPVSGSITLGPTVGRVLTKAPDPQCTSTITEHRGHLVVEDGTTCVVGGTITGSVSVRPGASLIAMGTDIVGSVSVQSAAQVSLTSSSVRGGVAVSGSDTQVELFLNRIAGAVSVDAASSEGSVTMVGNAISGSLFCSGEATFGHGGFPNEVIGAVAGACSDL